MFQFNTGYFMFCVQFNLKKVLRFFVFLYSLLVNEGNETKQSSGSAEA